MQIKITKDAYNARRYSRPWIARVTFDASGKACYEFGHFVGAHGDEGLLVLDAPNNSIIATGQKDYRKNSSEIYFKTVENDAISESISKAEAFEKYQEFKV